MNILFAPDYCRHNPYQHMLACALMHRGCAVRFLSGYRRGLPLTRGSSAGSHPLTDVLHLHWPEAYFRSGRNRVADWIRAVRYPLDLALASLRRPLVVTVHNLFPHASSPLSQRNMRLTYRRADALIAHSDAAAAITRATFCVDGRKVRVIPHGDLADGLPALPEREVGRRELGLPNEGRIGLMFGALSPYKGIEEVARLWDGAGIDARLYVVGDSFSDGYATELKRALFAARNVTLVRGRVADAELVRWLAAADCAVFNYREILTSGSACLARSLGIPVALPARLSAVDLGEPHPHVVRFRDDGSDFAEAVSRAMEAARGPELAESWRAATSWGSVASQTREVYEEALALPS